MGRCSGLIRRMPHRGPSTADQATNATPQIARSIASCAEGNVPNQLPMYRPRSKPCSERNTTAIVFGATPVSPVGRSTDDAWWDRRSL
jgi:hypothetical protein